MQKKEARKAKCTPNSSEVWELEHSPIWQIQGNKIVPHSLCLKWWQSLAKRKYRDKEMWLEIAYELGYVTKSINPKSGNVVYESYGFEYDGALIRKSLGLSENSPLVFREVSVNNQLYSRLWDKLLKEEINEDSSNLG